MEMEYTEIMVGVGACVGVILVALWKAGVFNKKQCTKPHAVGAPAAPIPNEIVQALAEVRAALATLSKLTGQSRDWLHEAPPKDTHQAILQLHALMTEQLKQMETFARHLEGVCNAQKASAVYLRTLVEVSGLVAEDTSDGLGPALPGNKEEGNG
jgi:hypothetical protein